MTDVPRVVKKGEKIPDNWWEDGEWEWKVYPDHVWIEKVMPRNPSGKLL